MMRGDSVGRRTLRLGGVLVLGAVVFLSGCVDVLFGTGISQTGGQSIPD